MNLLEKEIARYERRVERIGGKPQGTMLQANKIYYEIIRDFHKKILEDWQKGRPIAYNCGPVCQDLMIAMGIQPVDLLRMADRQTRDAPTYIDACRAAGFDPQFCTRTGNAVGLALTEELPRPSFVISAVNCTYMNTSLQYLAGRYKVPLLGVGVDHYTSLEEGIPYIVSQLREFIEDVERLTGQRYNEEKHLEIQEFRKQAWYLQQEIWDLVKSVPCPIRVRDAQRQFIRELVDPRMLGYYRAMRDELRRRVQARESPIANEKVRLMWLQAPPIFADTLSAFEEKGVSFPFCEVGLQPYDYEFFTAEDWGRGTPLEKEARYLFSGGFIPPRWRVARLLQACREYQIDGIVHFIHKSCPVSNGSTRIIADTAQKELGLPTLSLDGDYIDVRDFSQAEYEAKLNEFVDLCLSTKTTRHPFSA